MLKGTRILEGVEATQYVAIVDSLRNACKNVGYEEVIFPSLYEVEPFIEKGGEEIVGQLWNFKDKGDRDVTLIPEVTALVQERWRDHWSKNSSSKRIFYVNRCYRYERPQQGRYREFTQFGIELLGKPKEFVYGTNEREEVMSILKQIFDCFTDNLGIEFDYNDNVVRGLGYYVDNGFEVEAKWLGAQKQVAGGGAYAEGVGFAIGVDRLMLALTAAQSTNKLELVK
jgi:histidyl-tRNA synthetase